jgi:hypothetical protein
MYYNHEGLKAFVIFFIGRILQYEAYYFVIISRGFAVLGKFTPVCYADVRGGD